MSVPILGRKWGEDKTLGTPGGTVTWSIAGPGLDISIFSKSEGESVDPHKHFPSDYDYVGVIQEAFNTWQSVANIQFEQVDDCDMDAGARGADQGQIRIYFGRIPGGTAGWAFYVSHLGPGNKAGDILLDTLPFHERGELLYHLVLHEIGHALGLLHADGENSIMNGKIKRSGGLRQMDIDAIQSIYGPAVVTEEPAPDPEPVSDDPTPEPDPEPMEEPSKDLSHFILPEHRAAEEKAKADWLEIKRLMRRVARERMNEAWDQYEAQFQ